MHDWDLYHEAEDWKQDRIDASGYDVDGLLRSEVINALHEKGYKNIGSRDISWATRVGLIKPHIITKNLHIYREEDVSAMKMLSNAKRIGLDRFTIERMLTEGALAATIKIAERIKYNSSGDR